MGSIKMQFFAIAATFFAAVMATWAAKPLMDPTTTTVGQAAEQCGVNQRLSCCNGDDASSCSPVGSANLLQLLQSARLATLMPAPSAARLTTRLVSSTSTSSATTSSRTSASSVPANKRLAFCGFLQYSCACIYLWILKAMVFIQIGACKT